MVFSMLKRFVILTAKGANIPIHKTGSAVKRLAKAALIFNDSLIVSSKGETEVITGRRLSAAIKIATIGKI